MNDFGNTELYNRLANDPTVTGLIDDYTDDFATTFPALWDLILCPDDFPLEGKSINFYRSSPMDGAIAYRQNEFTINCRAFSQAEAEEIADAVYDSLNRYRAGIHCTILQTIEPQSLDTDNYNSIVIATLKKERSNV